MPAASTGRSLFGIALLGFYAAHTRLLMAAHTKLSFLRLAGGDWLDILIT